MKTLYLVRHAKSSWENTAVADFDRKLNERGQKDAPEMGQRLLKRVHNIDAFVSSPAKRAKKTCKLFCKEFGVKEEDIIYVDSLYLASPQTFAQVISWFDDSLKSVAIFSHNPGITDFANTLNPEVIIDNMPTCSIFAVQADVKHWKDFEAAEKKFLFFDYPKRL
ncbi:MAG: histidine phosphatase family protein [Chitinophagaceae bacterium]|nr:MAG: histidine phosphatase family protein [Chitinophagaceae bacterium]